MLAKTTILFYLALSASASITSFGKRNVLVCTPPATADGIVVVGNQCVDDFKDLSAKINSFKSLFDVQNLKDSAGRLKGHMDTIKADLDCVDPKPLDADGSGKIVTCATTLGASASNCLDVISNNKDRISKLFLIGGEVIKNVCSTLGDMEAQIGAYKKSLLDTLTDADKAKANGIMDPLLAKYAQVKVKYCG